MSSAENIPNIKIGVFPNPVSDRLIISTELEKGLDKDLTIQILDASGKHVLSRKLQYNDAFSVLDIDTQYWLPGMYSVQITSGNNTSINRKLIKI